MNPSAPGPRPRRRSEWEVYLRLLRYAKPYRWRLFLGLLFGILFGSSYLGALFSLRHSLGMVFSPVDLSPRMLWASAALLPAAALLMGMGNFCSRYFVEWVGNRVVMDLRNALFNHLHQLSLLYFSRNRTGDLISRITNDSMMVQRAVSTVIGDVVREPFALIAALGYLFWLDPWLSLASLVLFPVCVLPVMLFGRRVRRAAREGQKLLGDLVTILQETLSGVRVVKAFGMEAYESGRFRARNRSVFNRLIRVTRARASVEPIIVTISAMGLSLALMYARWTEMPTEAFFTFAAALVMMYQPVKKLSHIHMHVQQSSASAERIFEVLDTRPAVSEKPGAAVCEPGIRSIRFDRVGFQYDKETVLRDINFEVAGGERVALVGCSGAGKTTLVSLLPRFFDVTQGRLLINGRDVRDVTLGSLRGAIGIVTQETVLFHDTVAVNIAYGRPTAAREEIVAAARRAHAHEFIERMEQGYDTVIGDRGVRLSGGQCQRLAIARAMLRNPPLLILDEATSALDTESERLVQAALYDLMSARTVFMIAHRLSTVVRADRILVLDAGRIVEQGRHAELLAAGGQYTHLYNLQFATGEPPPEE